MAPFPSMEFCREAVALLNDDPAISAATEGWAFDVGLVIDGARPLAVHLGPPVGGRLPEPTFPGLEAFAVAPPAYFARADAATWRGLLGGTVDPIAAVVQRKLTVRGDLTPVIARLHHKGLAERWLARITLGEG